jgi:hypothetical protein
MALSGEAKRLYQRNYMANKRKSTVRPLLDPAKMLDPKPVRPINVRPIMLDPIRPDVVRPIQDTTDNFTGLITEHAAKVDKIVIQAATNKIDDDDIPPCPRGINPNVWTMQHQRKAGYQFKDRQANHNQL